MGNTYHCQVFLCNILHDLVCGVGPRTALGRPRVPMGCYSGLSLGLLAGHVTSITNMMEQCLQA